MKYTIKLILFLLFFQASVCYAIDCYGGSIEIVKDCMALGGCSWLGSDGLGSVHTKVRSYQCKDGSEYMLECARTQISSYFGSDHEEYAACSDVSQKEYLVKVGAKQTKFTPEEEKIDKRDRQKAKAHAIEMQKKADDYLQKQLQIMKKDQWKNNREKYISKYGGSFVDKRDGRRYRTIRIGDQNWMAENLRYEYKINGKKYGENCNEENKTFCVKFGTIYNRMDVVFDEKGVLYKDNNACYYKNENFCPYDTSEGLVMQGICPDGWRLPTRADWNKLKEFVGADSAARVLEASGDVWFIVDSMYVRDTTKYTLKSYNEYGWNTYKVFYGTDDFGFSVYPDRYFERLRMGGQSSFWIADHRYVNKYLHSLGTEWAGFSPFFANFSKYKYYDGYEFGIGNPDGPVNFGGAVRCIQNDDVSTRIITERRKKIDEMEQSRDQYIKKNGGSFVDERDGNKYKTIRIGNMNWMAENLRYNRFCRNRGRAVECSSEGKNKVGKIGHEYSSSLAKTISSNDGSVCPAGWHLPSSAEWSDLFAETGNDPANLMSSENDSDRNRYLNEFGFSLLMQKSNIWGLKPIFYWTSDEPDFVGFSKKAIAMDYKTIISSDQMFEESFVPSRRYVRCVKGKTDYEISKDAKYEFDLKNGGSFVDNRDGQKYRAVRMGNQIWMGDNLNFNNDGVIAEKNGGSVQCLNKEDGCRYQWPAATKACPIGWRLPEKDDFVTLFKFEENKEVVAKNLNIKVLESGNESEKGIFYGVFWSATEEKPSWVLNSKFDPSRAVYVVNFNKYGYDASSGKTHYDSIQPRGRGYSFPVRCIAESEEKAGVEWNDKTENRYIKQNRVNELKDVSANEKKSENIKQGPHIAFLGGFPLMEGQPGYRGYKGMNKVNSLIEGEAGYKVSYYWFVLGLNLGVTYMNFTRADKKQNFSYFYLGIPVSVRYPFTELFYVSGGVTYKRMLQFLGYPSYSEYIAMSGNTFLFSVSLGIMKGHWDFGLVVGTEYLGDEKSNRGENFRNRYLNIGINADCWF